METNKFGKVQNILYEEVIVYSFNYPKILHLYWDGSKLSYLNYLTIISFNKYHRNWKIIVYIPKNRTTVITWGSAEQRVKYDGTCYLDRLKEINNVSIEQVDLNDIGFKNSASEVIKSDYFRYYILYKYGGVWSDFDIIFTDSIEKKMNFKEDTVIFRCCSQDHNYYPVGFFIAKPDNIFFKYLMEQANKYYDPGSYQCIGANMWNILFPTVESIYNKNLGSVAIGGNDFYLPWAANQVNEFLVKKENNLPKNNIGVHWFNGDSKAKKYAIDLDKRILSNNFEINCYLDKLIYPFIKSDTKMVFNSHDPKTYNKVKVSIVMAYYNRKSQLIYTLKTISESSYKNFEIIIVDDASDPDQRVMNYIDDYKYDMDIKVITIKEDEKNWINPCIPYNIGFRQASGDIIIIQNPEVCHVGDCIAYAVEHLKSKDWLSFNCYDSHSFKFNEDLYKMNNKKQYVYINNSSPHSGRGGWLNHFSKHFVAYHYCAAIYREDLFNIMNGGFLEELKDGIGADDDEFIKRLLYHNFNFKINKFNLNEPFVIHQYHEPTRQIRKNIRNNREIFNRHCIKMNFVPENDIVKAPKTQIPMFKRVMIEDNKIKDKEINTINKVFGDIPIFWINLDDSVDRKNKMLEKLNQHNNIRIEAVDGRKMEYFKQNYNVTYTSSRNYTSSLIAVICSHFKAIKIGYDLNYKMICVLEDDTNFELISSYPNNLKDILFEAPKDWEIIQLYYIDTAPFFAEQVNDYKNNGLRILSRSKNYSGRCYLINRIGMKKLLTDIVTVDNNTFNIKVPLVDPEHLIFSYLKSYILNIPFVYNYDEKTTFDNYTYDANDNKAKSLTLQKNAKNELIRIHKSLFL